MSRINAFWNEAFSFGKELLHEFQADDCPSSAAALSFYAVFSMAPLLVVVILVAGLFLSPERANAAVNQQFLALVGASGAELIAGAVAFVQQNPGETDVARIVGGIAVLAGATGVMQQLQATLNRAWNVTPDPRHGGAWHFVQKRVLSFGLILAIAFLLLVSLVLTAIAAALAHQATTLLPDTASWAWTEGAHFGISLVIVAALFALLFRVIPEADVRWSDVVGGACATAVLFTVGKLLIGLYLGHSQIGTMWGTASSLAVLLVWVYYSSMIVLLGAEFTQVWTRRYGGGPRPPVAGAIVAHPRSGGSGRRRTRVADERARRRR